MNKQLTFLLSLTFLFLFSGCSDFGDELVVKKEYWDNGKLESETHYKNGKQDGMETSWFESGEKSGEYHWKNGKQKGLETHWYESSEKKSIKHFKNGTENGIRKEWDKNGLITYQENYVDGIEE